MRHHFVQITEQEVDILLPDPELPNGLPTILTMGPLRSVVGCLVCDMGLEEALTLPCPGLPVSNMLE